MTSLKTIEAPPAQRCAIYTRRSVDPGFEQEFNSLESQRAICSAYIASQRPKGWIEIPKHYDDAGRTGANLRRDAIQELLTDLESGLIDVVVIYKLDRITRTLLDFVRLMDLFEQYGVHFVSVTQNFDTGDSTGRLILNVLLTFAQFEREISSDRLRDKFGAMKERGMFVGGHPPYGFDLADKKLVINPDEAKVVRWIFKLYLELASYTKVERALRAKGITRRSRISKRGNLIRGREICAGNIWQMLENPIYIGRVRYHGTEFPGLQARIVSRTVWDRVQVLRAQRTRAKICQRHSGDLLRGLMFDAYGRSIGVFRDYRYNKEGTRYYLSNQSEWGRRHGVRRFRTKANELEQLVIAALSSLLSNRERVRAILLNLGVHDRSLDKLAKGGGGVAKTLEQSTPRQMQCALKALIERVELTTETIQIVIRSNEVRRFLEWNGVGIFSGETERWTRPHPTELLEVPTSTVRVKRDLRALLQQRGKSPPGKPKKYLVELIRRARKAQRLLDERSDDNLTDLATKLRCTHSRLARLMRLNYLAPDIIAAILDGRQPTGLTGHKLMATDLPMDWSLQRRILGFADQPDSLKAAPGW